MIFSQFSGLIFQSTLRGLLVLSLGQIIVSFMRRRRLSAARQHVVILVTFVAMLSLPLLYALLPPISIPLPGENPRPIEMANATLPKGDLSDAAESGSHAALSPQTIAKLTIPPAAAQSPIALSFGSLIVLLWSLGFTFVALRFIVGLIILRTQTARNCKDLASSARTALLRSLLSSTGLRRTIFLQQSDGNEWATFSAPVTFGLLRPTLLLPPEEILESWSQERLSSVLLHEIAHIRRCDWAARMLANVACSLYWFNPWVWGLSRNLDSTAEIACDDYALSAGVDAPDYAAHLLSVARDLHQALTARPRNVFPFLPCGTTLSMAQPASNIKARMSSVLAKGYDRTPVNSSTALGSVALALLVLAPAAAATFTVSERSDPITEVGADRRVVALLRRVAAAAEADRTLTADFTYSVTEPTNGTTSHKIDTGSVELMKPNFANISYNNGSGKVTRIVSDGTTRWTYDSKGNCYSSDKADPQGKNINVWRLINIGGFFDVYTWIRQGIYAENLDELTYAGVQTVNGVSYQVIEHKMTGTMQNRPCPFDQKVFIGQDNIIHRFTLDFQIDGKPGQEVAELTNIHVAAKLPPSEFVFSAPSGSHPIVTYTPESSAQAKALLDQVENATLILNTMSADFTYSVSSVKSQQMIAGNLKMMKPNFARIIYSYMAKPAFPNLAASDGKTVYKFTPASYRTDRKFDEGPFDSIVGAQQASGLVPGGGQWSETPADPLGGNVHLWDAAPVQAFFGPTAALISNLYVTDLDEIHYEGYQTINGATYQVLEHHCVGGNIAGGETSDFEQHVYIGADLLVHGYALEFTSGGKPGVQIVWLKNIRTNDPMAATDFSFTPPSAPTP